MTQVVVELVLDGRGVEQGSAQVEAAMQRARQSFFSAIDQSNRVQEAIRKQTMVLSDQSTSVRRVVRDWDRLRAATDPAIAAQIARQRDLENAVRVTERAVRKGIATQEEANAAFAKYRAQIEGAASLTPRITAANDNLARSSGLARHEIVNLGRQVQDIGVSLASGQSPLTVLVQQGTQVADVFASSQSTVGGFFRQLVGFLTPVRVLAGGVLGLGAAATLALSSWQSEQRELQRALAATGLGAGVTRAELEKMSKAAAEASGVSIARARATVAALANTGQISPAMITPVATFERDLAATLGIDSPAANKLLAESFRDPIAGAKRLNEALGGLSAATADYIQSLQSAGRRQEAAQVLLDNFRPRVEKATELTSFWARAWQSVATAASNAYTKVGEAIDRGLNPPGRTAPGQGDEDVLASLERQKREIQFNLNLHGRLPEAAAMWRDRLREVETEMTRVRRAIEGAGAAQQVLAQKTAEQAAADERARRSRETVSINERIGDPRIEQLRKYGEEYRKVWQTIQEQQRQRDIGGATELTDAQLERSRRSLAQLRESIDGLTGGARGNFNRVTRELIGDEQLLPRLTGINELIRTRIRLEADLSSAQASGNEWRVLEAQRNLTVFQQQQRGTEAGTGTERQIELEGQLGAIRRRNTDELNIARRDRELAANDNIAALRSELDMMGRSVGEQERARTEQQMLTEAKRRYQLMGRLMPQDEIDAIRAAATEIGRLRQAQAELRAAQDIRFDAAQMFRSDTERNVASQLRSIYNEDYLSQMNGVIAAQIRFNDQLRMTSDLAQDFGRTFVTDILNGKSATEALGNALKNVAARLIQMAMDQAIKSLFGGLMSIIGGGFGLGSLGSTGTAIPYANGGAFAGGNVVPFAKGGAFTNSIVDRPTIFPMARGAGLMGEGGPEGVLPLKRNARGQLGVIAQGGGLPAVHFGDTILQVTGSATSEDITKIKAELAEHRRQTIKMVQGVVAGEPSRRRAFATRAA